MLTPQASYWADAATADRLAADTPGPSQFVREVVRHVAAGAAVLDLGCGAGHDTAALAAAAGRAGRVVAVDVSTGALSRTRGQAATAAAPVLPVLADAGRELPLAPGALDVVYAHLSLHYFTDERTRELFGELRAALRPGGLLAVACKSTADPSFGRGTRLGPRTFADGAHLRHFFDAGYLADLLTGWTLLATADEPRELYGRPAAVVTAIARR